MGRVPFDPRPKLTTPAEALGFRIQLVDSVVILGLPEPVAGPNVAAGERAMF